MKRIGHEDTGNMLIIGAEEQTRIREIIEYSKQPENWYQPLKMPPKSAKDVVLRHGIAFPPSFEIKAIFTFTLQHGMLWRHLSVSIDRKDCLPSKIIVELVAISFGFTEAIREWSWSVPYSGVVEVIQQAERQLINAPPAEA